MNETLLFQQVIRKLNITWDDADTNNRVSDIITDAKAEMSRRFGISADTFDFSESGIINKLFKSYCLYIYNHCENEWENNYMSDILAARALFEVEQYGEE